jgi:hypothetical protein
MSAQTKPFSRKCGHESPNNIHVIPLNDIREHWALPECWCKPTLDDEYAGTVYVHHSADGREDFEEGYRTPS